MLRASVSGAELVLDAERGAAFPTESLRAGSCFAVGSWVGPAIPAVPRGPARTGEALRLVEPAPERPGTALLARGRVASAPVLLPGSRPESRPSRSPRRRFAS